MRLNLVVQTAFLGDLLLSIPLLKKTRLIWPEHKLALVCRKGLGDFFLKTNLVDQVFEVEKGRADSYNEIVAHLRFVEVDHLISPHESLRTAFFCARINARVKVSFKKNWNFCIYSERTKKNEYLPDALRQLSLLESFNQQLREDLADYIKNEKPFVTSTFGRLTKVPLWASMSLRNEILSSEDKYKDLERKFELMGFEDGRSVLLFPGSVWATKKWTEKGFVEVGQQLQKQGFKIFVMGGPGEEALAENVAKEINGARSLAGKTKIIESAQLIARAALVIGNDSASAHLAAVCETPVIAVFGPTILEFGFRPWSSQSYVIQNENIKCRPCGKHGHKKCPIKTHECMESISSKEVLKTAQHILGF